MAFKTSYDTNFRLLSTTCSTVSSLIAGIAFFRGGALAYLGFGAIDCE